MMRWWWFGPAVDRAELDRELTAMAQTGLGGVEVAYVYPLSAESPAFLSTEFLADLRYAAERAQGLGLRFDLTLGSGWSFGGPHVTAEHAARRLHWERREIPGGSLRLSTAAPWPGDVLVAAYVGSGSLQETPDDFRLLAIEDAAIVVPVGVGPRVVLLAYAQLTGQNVKRAARGAEGPVFDHYSAVAAAQHLRHVGDRLLEAVPPALVGSVFCDSLEVYGSDWTPDLPAEFGRRRGYDLLPELHRLTSSTSESSRLRADYHQTLTELYEERFVAMCQRWAAARGVPFRIQGYGTPPAMISSYRHADLFEGEGWGWTELTQTRWASSAAHLYGRNVVSSETWTWVHSPSFRATPLDLQGEAHEHLLAGINQLIGHGWPYSPPDAPGLGWIFYASGALDDRNPWWPAMPALAQQLTRLCWLMQQGEPVNDVLLYVSSRDVFARMGTAVGGTLDAWREAVQVVGNDVVKTLRQGGWDYNLVDDDALAVLPADGSRPVVVAGATELPEATWAWLDRHAAAGGSVVTVRSSVEIAGARSAEATDLAAVLASCCPPDVRIDPAAGAIGTVHRRTADSDIYLVVNTGPVPQSFAWTPRSDRGSYEQWDVRSGQVSRSGGSTGGLDLTLHPYQATVIVLTDAPPMPAEGDAEDLGTRQLVLDGWQVQFAGCSAAQPVDLPHRWEDQTERLGYSGSATYRCSVDLPELGPTTRVVLDLGAGSPSAIDSSAEQGIRGHSYQVQLDPPVAVMAEIRVNGVDCGIVWAPPYTVEVSAATQRGTNQIEITVANTAANALATDEHVRTRAAMSEQRHGRRFRMQELDRAMFGVRSGLLTVPVLTIR